MTADNPGLLTQINALMEERNELLKSGKAITQDQLTVTKQLLEAMQSISYKDVATDINNTTQAITAASEATKGLGTANRDVFANMTAALKDGAQKQKEVGTGYDELAKKSKKFIIASSAIDGFVQGLRLTANFMRNVISVGSGLIGSLGHIGAAIISIPFKMLEGLITMADSGGGDNSLQEALEGIRKEFGALHADSGLAIRDMARGMKGELAQTGLSTMRIFGNLAERLKTMQEYATNLGPLFAVLAGQFVKNSEAIGAYYKGLGLTAEAQKAVATRSFALGTAVTEELRQIANYSLQLSKAFHGAAGSSKEISRDIGTLMADFKHFGGIATKEIAQTVVYFRRLGVEVTKVLGVLDRYDNFQDAADGAAHLSQAFGMNVDALEMMKAQNPAQRVEMLRKSFFAAGRSVENMTRQERALLAQQTGLDDSALDLVFSMKNQGQSYDQVTKKADAAKKKQLSQAEAMKSLADSIERLVKSGSAGKGGFLDRFIQGFGVGVQRSSEFRSIMRNLRIDLRIAYTEGIKVGRAFVNMFPGVRDVLKGIADLFQPRRFRMMFREVTATFKAFFSDMTTNPTTAMPRLLERLKTNFFNWLQPNSPNGRRILDGFKSFFKAIGEIAGGMLKIAIHGITDGIKFITDLISGRVSISAPSDGGFISSLFRPMIAAIVEAGPALWTAIKEMFGAIWTKLQPWLANNWLKILGVLTGPALLGFGARIITTAFATIVLGGIGGWIKEGGLTKAFNFLRGRTAAAAAAIPAVPGGAGAGAGVPAVPSAAAAGADAVNENRTNWKAAIGKLALIALFITVMVGTMMVAIVLFLKATKGYSSAQILTAAATLVGIGLAVSMMAISAAFVIKAAEAVQGGNLRDTVKGLLVIGAVVVGMVALGSLAILALSQFSPASVGKAVLAMTAIGLFVLAAAAITLIAAAVGAIAMTGFGGAAIGIGLGIVAGTVTAMTIGIMDVMVAIDRFRPTSSLGDFVQKVHAFAEIMKAIGAFAGTIAQIAEATRPSFFSFRSGAAEQRATLDSVGVLIRNLSAEIINIINILRTSIQAMSGSPEELKAAAVIGELLGGVGSLAGAISAPAAALAEPGLLARITGASSSAATIAALRDYIQTISPELRSFITQIQSLVTNISAGSGFTEAQKRVADTVPAILTSIGTLSTSLLPSPALVEAMSRRTQFVQAMQQLTLFVSTVLGLLSRSNLFKQIQTLITAITTATSSLTSSQATTLTAVAPILTPLFSVISSIATTISTLSRGGAAPTSSADAGVIFQLTNMVSSFFANLSTTLPTLLTSLRTVFAGINLAQINIMSKGMEALSKVFEVVGTVPAMLNAMKGESATPRNLNVQDITRNLNFLRFLLLRPQVGITAILTDLIPALVTLTGMIPNGAGFSAKIEAIKNVFDILGGIPAMLAGFTKAGNARVDERVMDVPLMNLNTIIRGLTSTGTSNGPNPLMNNGLQNMLKGFSGISQAQKVRIGSSLEKIKEVSDALTAFSVTDSSANITTNMQFANANLLAFITAITPTTTGDYTNFANNLAILGPSLINLSTMLNNVQMTRVASVVTTMVSQINAVSSEIHNLAPLNIETGLKNLGDTIGLGATGNYTVTNRNFTINVNFVVKFDNNGLDAFEVSMLRRVGPGPGTRLQQNAASLAAHR